MKNITLLITILLIFSCSQKNQDFTSKKDSVSVAIDTVVVNIDSSKIENSEQENVFEVEPKDGKYSHVIKHKDISAEIFYTIIEGRVDYYKLKIYNGKKVQEIKAVSDWEFRNVDEMEFLLQDVNFDGVNDITISKEVGMNWFKLNVWINKGGKFIQEKKFNEFYSPIFNL